MKEFGLKSFMQKAIGAVLLGICAIPTFASAEDRPFVFSVTTARSELELETKLHLPRRQLAEDSAEVRRSEDPIGNVKIRALIECIGAEELDGAASKRVAARFSDDVDRSRCLPAELDHVQPRFYGAACR